MASTGVFELTEKTTTESVFPFPIVDTTDTTQAAVGSLVKVTLANVFHRRTVTVSDPIIDATQTWNASGVVFTAIKLNVTNTASNTGSLLIDLQVGGASQFKVDKAGNTTLASGSTLAAQAVTATSLVVSSSSGYVATYTKTSNQPQTKWTGAAGDDFYLGFTAADTFSLVKNDGTTPIWSATQAGALTIASGLTVAAGGITVSAGTTSVVNLTASTDIQLVANNHYLYGLTSGSASTKLIGIDANNVVQLGDNAVGVLSAFIRSTSTGQGGTNANYKGVMYAATDIAGTVVFYDGATGARYKLTGTAF